MTEKTPKNTANRIETPEDYEILHGFFDLGEVCNDIKDLAEVTKVSISQYKLQADLRYVPDFLKEELSIFGNWPQEIGLYGEADIYPNQPHQSRLVLKTPYKDIILSSSEDMHAIKIGGNKTTAISSAEFSGIIASIYPEPDEFNGLGSWPERQELINFYKMLGTASTISYKLYSDLGQTISTTDAVGTPAEPIATGLVEYVEETDRERRTERISITRHHIHQWNNQKPANTVYTGSYARVYDSFIKGEVSLASTQVFHPSEFCVSQVDENYYFSRKNEKELPIINDYNELLRLTLLETIHRNKQFKKL